MNKGLRNTFAFLSLLGAVDLGFIGVLENYFHRSNKKEKIIYSDKIESIIQIQKPLIDKWFSDSKVSDLSIRSYDGLNLKGCLIENNPSNVYIICTHGYKGDMKSSLNTCYNLDNYGYNFLIHDCRASGLSEGKYHTMGKMESLDLIAWIAKLIELRPDCKIVLYGVSMGASISLLTLSNKLPENVKCVVSDCAFARFQDVVIRKAESFGINFLPLIPVFELIMIERFHMSFKDIDATEALKNNHIPLLMIHGKEDTVVPFNSMKKLYNANTEGKRKYYPVEKANHNECRYSKNYYINIDEFIKGEVS